MALKAYESLLQQVQALINTAVPGGVTITTKNAITDLSRNEASDFGFIIKGISDALGDIIESRIISGLDVTASSPPSATVSITAGKGTAAGKLYELENATTVKVNFDEKTSVFFIVLYEKKVLVTQVTDANQCQLAKIIVPEPGVTSAIVDDKPSDGYDAYIVSAKDIVYSENQIFDDASKEKLRDIIGEVMADNLIGNIKLSENLKIINTHGTIELDSNSLKIKDLDQTVLAKFNKDGTYFYDVAGRALAKFTATEANIGNILITKNSIQTRNFLTGAVGFQIKDSGDVEFNDGIFRGTLSANVGNIGGWTLTADEIYATTTGTIKTSINAGAGYNGVVLDKDGLRVYDDILGEVINLPSDGSAPSFSSGIIEETIFEINTNAVLRTSLTVGDGSADSAGILINNTGMYGCGANQLLTNANFKVLANGNAYFKGQIQATSGTIGGVTISETVLTGGTLIGTLIRGATFETSAVFPKVLIDSTGVSFQVTPNIGQYGDIKYGLNVSSGAGIFYGAGVSAFLFNEDYPILSIMAERNLADVRLYNRDTDPAAGTHQVGDVITVDSILKNCRAAGTPGTFEPVGNILENLTSDPGAPELGRMWLRTDL